MVDDLLDTSRIQSGLLKTCRKMNDLGEIVNHVKTMLTFRAEAKNISLKVRSIPADMQVFCDDEKLRRILINLVVNAIKFTPAEGNVEISASLEGTNQVKITVSDNGHGIAKEDLNRIFQRFQQASKNQRMASCKGFGLGLGIARSLASLNFGSLQVESIEGQGSQFSVLVPAGRIDAALNCFLDKRETLCKTLSTQNEQISVVEVRPEISIEDDEGDVLEAIDDFLRVSVMNFDLIVRVAHDRWLMYTRNSRTSAKCLIVCFQDQWAKFQRNNFGKTLPSLVFNCLETVKLQGGRQRLLEFACLPEEIAAQTGRNGTVTATTAVERKKILVVDDDVEVANAIHCRLDASGFDVQTVHNGFAGLEAAQNSEPDAILLDIRMPEMDGLGVLDKLKSIDGTKTTPVIMLSASHTDQQQALDRGANFFIRKPFKSDAVLAAINDAIQAQ